MADNRISIAFFLPSLEPGGAEKNIINILNNINSEKYKTALVLGEKKGGFLSQINKCILIFDLSAAGSLKLFLTGARYLKKEKPDIFVSAFSRINIIFLAAKIFSGSKTKIVVTEHSIFSFLPVIAKTPGRRLFARLILPHLARVFYPKAHAIVCVSKGIAEDFAKNIGCKQKIRTIYNPVTDDKIERLAGEELEEQWLLRLKVPIIIAVGRLVKCKNYPGLFRAFSQVIKKHPAHLVILGEGPEENNLKKLASELLLSSSVAFLGFKKNPYKYVKRADVFVLSSVQEGFGNAIVEAMACGTPVVATNCPTGPGEIIQNMKNGILVPLDDEEKFASAILKILENSSFARKIAYAGKKRAMDFSIKTSVEKYENIFEQLKNA